jgi:hypothetical protein
MADSSNSSSTADWLNFLVDARPEGDGLRIDVDAGGRSISYAVPTPTQQDFSAFYRALAHDFGGGIGFRGRAFKQQLVMHRQNHPGGQTSLR